MQFLHVDISDACTGCVLMRTVADARIGCAFLLSRKLQQSSASGEKRVAVSVSRQSSLNGSKTRPKMFITQEQGPGGPIRIIRTSNCNPYV